MTSPQLRADTLLPVAGPRESWSWLFAEVRNHGVLASGTLVLGVVAAAAAVFPAYIFGELVDRVRGRESASSIATISIVLVVAAVVGGISAGAATYLTRNSPSTAVAWARRGVWGRSPQFGAIRPRQDR